MRVDGLAERLAGRLSRGQAAAEALMGCTFSAWAPTDTPVIVGGLEVQAYELQPFTEDVDGTPGKVQGGAASTRDPVSRTVNVGGVSRLVLVGGLHIPITAPVPAAGDRGIGWEYQCTAVVPAGDQSLVGRWYLVVSAPGKAYATARRLDVVEVPVPKAFA